MFLSVDIIKAMRLKVEEMVSLHFSKAYKEGDISKGKNLIIYEIAKRYVNNFLSLELDALKQGHQIKITAIEIEHKVAIDIPELSFPVHITGKIDRVDEYNGIPRILDYKTGKVVQSKVEVVNWEDLTTDYDSYSKSFQVLTYVYSMYKDGAVNLPVEAGIISFKNLSAGVLKFAKKDKAGNYAKKEVSITSETLLNFENQLKQLIIEICNPDIPFVEKEL